MRWIEEGLGIVPTDFNVILEELSLDTKLKEAVAKLLESKRSGDELDKGPRIQVISAFIESELRRWEISGISKRDVHHRDNKLDEFFRECIKKVW